MSNVRPHLHRSHNRESPAMILRNRGKSHFKPTSGVFVAGWPIQVGPRIQLAFKKARWGSIPRPEFHGLIGGLAGLERRSPPGSIRSHYRRRRLAAVEFYARVFGAAPQLLRERHLMSGSAFYRTTQYKEWSSSAYSPAVSSATRVARSSPYAA